MRERANINFLLQTTLYPNPIPNYPKHQVVAAFKILNSNPKVEGILGNIFG